CPGAAPVTCCSPAARWTSPTSTAPARTICHPTRTSSGPACPGWPAALPRPPGTTKPKAASDRSTMSTPSDSTNDADGGLDCLLPSFARRVPDVTHALAVSVDGLTLAASDGLPVDRSDQLSAITSGLASLTVGAAKCLSTGRVRQTVVDMDGGVLLVMAVGD